MFGFRKYFARRKFHAIAVKTFQRTRRFIEGTKVVGVRTDEVPVTFYENELGQRRALAVGLDDQPRPDETIAIWLAGGSLPEGAHRICG
jgi:hypothetical protein